MKLPSSLREMSPDLLHSPGLPEADVVQQREMTLRRGKSPFISAQNSSASQAITAFATNGIGADAVFAQRAIPNPYLDTSPVLPNPNGDEDISQGYWNPPAMLRSAFSSTTATTSSDAGSRANEDAYHGQHHSPEAEVDGFNGSSSLFFGLFDEAAGRSDRASSKSAAGSPVLTPSSHDASFAEGEVEDRDISGEDPMSVAGGHQVGWRGQKRDVAEEYQKNAVCRRWALGVYTPGGAGERTSVGTWSRQAQECKGGEES